MKYHVRLDGEEIVLDVVDRDGCTYVVLEADGRELPVELCPIRSSGSYSLLVGDASLSLVVSGRAPDVTITLGSETWHTHVLDAREAAAAAVGGEGGSSGSGIVHAVMPGIVREMRVAVGDTVAAGEPLLILEAMKMQNEIRADGDGVVVAVLVEAGAAVAKGDALVQVE